MANFFTGKGFDYNGFAKLVESATLTKREQRRRDEWLAFLKTVHRRAVFNIRRRQTKHSKL